MTFPTADHVACAIVAAARLTGEDPEACAYGRAMLRCRMIAFELLRADFPDVQPARLAPLVGVPRHPPKVAQNYNSRPRSIKLAAEVSLARDAYRDLLGRLLPAATPAGSSSREPEPRRPALEGAAFLPPLLDGKAPLRDMLAQALANTPGAVKVER